MPSSVLAADTASERVRFAINAVLEYKDLQMNLVRIDKLKELGKSILDRVIGSEAERAAFSDFSSELTTVLRDTLHTSATY